MRLNGNTLIMLFLLFVLTLIAVLNSGCGYQIQLVDVRDKYIREIQQRDTRMMELYIKIDSLETELDDCKRYAPKMFKYYDYLPYNEKLPYFVPKDGSLQLDTVKLYPKRYNLLPIDTIGAK